MTLSCCYRSYKSIIYPFLLDFFISFTIVQIILLFFALRHLNSLDSSFYTFRYTSDSIFDLVSIIISPFSKFFVLYLLLVTLVLVLCFVDLKNFVYSNVVTPCTNVLFKYLDLFSNSISMFTLFNLDLLALS